MVVVELHKDVLGLVVVCAATTVLVGEVVAHPDLAISGSEEGTMICDFQILSLLPLRLQMFCSRWLS